MTKLQCQSCGAALKIVTPRWDGLIQCVYCGTWYRNEQPELDFRPGEYTASTCALFYGTMAVPTLGGAKFAFR